MASINVEDMIQREIDEMQSGLFNLRCTRHEMYRIGKVAGMLKAYQTAGLISEQQRQQLFDYFMDKGI